MGESIVETRTKMGESVATGPTLEASVSFGRFDNDSLSWEKWSSFSPNKYLEEVEKCSTPGSVAQKKAYFEAHYKKIAARKAEQLEQERPTETVLPGSDEPKHGNHVENSCGVDNTCGLPNEDGDNHVENTCVLPDGNHSGKFENTSGFDHSCGAFEGRESPTKGEKELAAADVEDSVESKEDVATGGECQNSFDKEDKGAITGNLTNPGLSEKAILFEEDIPQDDSQEFVVHHPTVNAKPGKSSLNKKKNLKPNSQKASQKINPSREQRTASGIKKKLVPPTTKPSQVSTSRLSKPGATSMMVSPSQALTRKVNGSTAISLARGKKSPMAENKRPAPTSLHMSLSLGPTNSSASLTTTRKSLIMESMADKDIVRRAFKTFQSNLNHTRPSSDKKVGELKQVPFGGSEQRLSTSLTSRKENERLKKGAITGGQPRTRSNTMSSGLLKEAGLDRKKVSAVSPSVGTKSDGRTEKRGAFAKKLGEKSYPNEVEKGPLTSNSKVARNGETKKLRQNINNKAILTNSFTEKETSKSPLRKEGFTDKLCESGSHT